MTVYEQRQAAKQRITQARTYATEFLAALLPNAKVPAHGRVDPAEGGVFVEVVLWIPDEVLDTETKSS